MGEGSGEPRRPSTAVVAAALAPSVFSIAVLVIASRRFEQLFPTWLYLLDAGLFLLSGLGLVIAAFLADRAGRGWLSRIGLGLGVSLGLLGLSDAYIVLFRFDSSGPGGFLCFTHRNWTERYVHDNADGYWEDDLTPIRERGPGGPLVIAVVGDSFTWGQGLPGRELRWTDLLEADLRRAGREVEVLNFGVGGTGTTRQITEVMPAVRSVRPDLVLIGYLTNDIDDHVSLARIDYPQQSPQSLTLTSLTPTFNFAYWHILGPSRYAQVGERSFFGWITAYRDPDNMKKHLASVRELVEGAREGGTPVLVANLPFPQMWAVVNPGPRDVIVGKILAAAASCGAVTTDLAELESEFPPGRFELNPLDGHPNPVVHRAIARELLKTLQAHPELFGGRGSAPLLSSAGG